MYAHTLLGAYTLQCKVNGTYIVCAYTYMHVSRIMTVWLFMYAWASMHIVCMIIPSAVMYPCEIIYACTHYQVDTCLYIGKCIHLHSDAYVGLTASPLICKLERLAFKGSTKSDVLKVSVKLSYSLLLSISSYAKAKLTTASKLAAASDSLSHESSKLSSGYTLRVFSFNLPRNESTVSL